jgi:hypothetical protein
MEETRETTPREHAADLAYAIWRGIDGDYKRSYAKVIWGQFLERLQGTARTTANLEVYFNRVCSKLPMVWDGKQITEYLDWIYDAMRAGQDREILRIMREQTAAIVVEVRLKNEQHRLEYNEGTLEGGIFDED